MNADRWARIRELFETALELAPEDRDPWLHEHTAGDEDLRAGVVRMLRADARDHTPVEAAGPAVIRILQPAALMAELGGATVEPYRTLEPLGQGGMGAVYLAERADGSFDRKVALKLVHPGFDSEDILRRFHSERRILASLEHPNIARLYDAGRASDGRPFLAMEFVEGEPIHRWLEGRRADLRERIELFLQVCDAVAYAHRSLVIHRDLKPANILVGSDGAVKLLDFGIAKLADDAPEPRTRTGQRLLTPEYASPEQLRGEVLSTASDVYSLGSVLYEVITGLRPFPDAASALAHAFGGDARGPIPTPSRVDGLHPLLESRGLRLQGDLDRIILKALARDSSDRYATVEALAGDLRRFLEGRPVSARRPSWGYRTSRFLRRHRLATTAVTVALVALFSATWVAVEQARQARIERDTAEGVSRFLEDLFTSSDPRGGQISDTTRVMIFLENAADQVRTGWTDQPEAQARLLYVLGRVARNLSRADLSTELLRAAVLANRSVHGPGHEDEIQARELLALELTESGDLEGGLPQLDSALALQIGRAGEGDPLTWRLRERLAQVYATAQRNEDALPHIEAVVAAVGAANPPDRPRLASALNLHGSVLAQLGRPADAADALAESADTWGLAGGSLDEGGRALDEGVTRNNLAFVLMQLGRLEEAEAQSRRSRALLRPRLPERHGLMARTDIRLAEILAARWREEPLQGLQVEADSLFRVGLALGRDIPEVRGSLAFPLSSYGGALRSWNRLPEAEAVLEEALERAQVSLGQTHTVTHLIASDLGQVIAAQGRIQDGLRRTRDAYGVLRESLPPGTPPRLTAALNQGRALARAGYPDQAVALVEEEYESAQSTLSADHSLLTTADDLLAEWTRVRDGG